MLIKLKIWLICHPSNKFKWKSNLNLCIILMIMKIFSVVLLGLLLMGSFLRKIKESLKELDPSLKILNNHKVLHMNQFSN